MALWAISNRPSKKWRFGKRIEHGVAVIATGATAFKPDEYSYGDDRES
jgi:hypothetical protein